MLNTNLQPKRITDIMDNIDTYLEEMRKNEDMKSIPSALTNYIWNFFRDVNPDKDKLKMLALFLADHTYRYVADVKLTDDYTEIYFASVVSVLWDTLQARGVDTFYILDNEIREDRFMLAVKLFALSGVAVVTPYVIKGNYHKYMSIEEQAKWALSFSREDFDPKKYTITIDTSDDMRFMEVRDLIKKYMDHTRNIVYIEKDASVNYLDQVKKIAEDSKYLSIFRNNAPTDPNVTIIKQS